MSTPLPIGVSLFSSPQIRWSKLINMPTEMPNATRRCRWTALSNHSRKFALQQQNVERLMRVVNVVSGAMGCHIFLKLDKILSVTWAARLIGISPPCPRVATLPGHQISLPCLGLRGVGQGGHPFFKSIIKIRRNRRSFHFTPATLAIPATFTSMGQRKTQQEIPDATT